MAREYFCVYHSYLRSMRNLSDAECGRLFRALIAYSAGDELINLQGREAIAFDFIAAQIDREAQAYQEKCETNRVNRGRRSTKSAEIAEESRPQESSENTVLRPLEKSTTVKISNDRTQEKEEEKEEEKYSYTFSSEKVCRTEDVRRVVEAWNSLGLATVRAVAPGSQRQKWLAKRIRDYGIESVLLAIENVRKSTFLKGGSKSGWQITFDWFLRPNNFPKVLDGNYNDGEEGEHEYF